jgi:hypothetical protein
VPGSLLDRLLAVEDDAVGLSVLADELVERRFSFPQFARYEPSRE